MGRPLRENMRGDWEPTFDTDGPELLPCPFCGRPANIHSWYSDKDECGVAWVGCTKESYANGYECARISIMRIDEKTAHEDAITAWNRRAQ